MEEQTNLPGIEVVETHFECEDCHDLFFVSRERQEWLKAKRLRLRKLCPHCFKTKHSRQDFTSERTSEQEAETNAKRAKWDADFEATMSKLRQEVQRWQS